jgi:hypothetical protein
MELLLKRHTKFRVSNLAALLMASACGQNPQHTVLSDGTPCEGLLGKEMVFLGKEECFRALGKITTFSGYWVIRREYSVFYRDLKSASLEYDDDAVWLELSSKVHGVSDSFQDGKGHIVQVTFTGIESNRPGFYGHAGAFKRGILADHFSTLNEIHQAPVSSP